MTDYDSLFEATTPDDSVFSDKGALDPLADPDRIDGRENQEEQLATVLNGINEGYLPATISVYGPPGTGKTLTTRRICREFAQRNDHFAVEYVNLKECQTSFSAANEIHRELTGEKKGAHAGLDGVFEGIWTALEEYPEWTVLILDEIDQIRYDTNYDPNDFFYRLLRGEGRIKRDLDLSVVLCSNELIEVDLRLDSRVESTMANEEVFFPPYSADALRRALSPRLDAAFRDGALSDPVVSEGLRMAANRWGDARKTLTLFREAGETANERGLAELTVECLEANLATTQKDAVVNRISQLPRNHAAVLVALTGTERNGEIVQPVTSAQVKSFLGSEDAPEDVQLGARAIREVITQLETMNLIETWTEAQGQDGRVKQIETAFDPQWVAAAFGQTSKRPD